MVKQVKDVLTECDSEFNLGTTAQPNIVSCERPLHHHFRHACSDIVWTDAEAYQRTVAEKRS